MAKNLLRRRNKRTQGMTEYIIIVGLIAIAVITAVQAFSTAVEGSFEAAEKKITDTVIAEINKQPTAAASSTDQTEAARARADSLAD